MYGIISLAGMFLRQFFLPNPFTNLFPNQGYADIFNLFFGGVIIWFCAYFLTGRIYQKGEAPFIGSILYTFNYALITFSFLGITLLIKNVVLACIVYAIIYIIVCIILSRFNSRTIY